MNRPYMLTGGRYPVLRAIGILYLIAAAIVAGVGIIAAAWIMIQLGDRSMGQRFMLALSTLGGAFLAVISMLAIAEVIKLFMDMAQSLRAMALNQQNVPVAEPVTPEPMVRSSDGHRNRLLMMLDDETAESALLRGH